MKERFRNKYYTESIRLKNWDYSKNGKYFVTICCGGRECYFGKIINQKMNLSEIGIIANNCWIEIKNHFPFVILNEHVIMPDHIHGIIEINRKCDKDDLLFDKIEYRNTAETLHATSPHLHPESLMSPHPHHKSQTSPHPHPKSPMSQQIKNEKMSTISPKPGSLSTIIRSYKSAVTKQARQIKRDFHWQSRFHDRIIKNDESYHRIKKYIIENPEIWMDDR